MIKLIALWSCIGICSIAYAQVITIVDQKTDEPLELVSIASTQPKAFTTTNAAGQADVSAFNGSEKIEIRYIGYNIAIRSFSELQEAEFVVRLEHSGVFLDQVVISASRWSQRSRDVPARIASISARETALLNPQTAADMLWASGEVFIQKSQQGGGSPMIRGFATNRLLYSVDGVRMNTAIFRSGNVQNVIALDPFAIERAEVLFGPGSVIYGSDAIGGVMSFTTLTPQLSYSDAPLIIGSAVVRYASANDEKTTHFNVNAGWNKWSLLTSFSSSDYGDLRMGTNGPEEYLRHYFVQRQDSIDRVISNEDPLVQKPSGYAQINVMQKIRFAPNNKWDFQYGLHYSKSSNFSRYDRLLRLRNSLPRSAEWYYGPQEWLMNNLSVTHSGNNGLYDQMSIRLAHQFFEESRIDRDLNRPTKFIRLEQVNALSTNLDFMKSIRSRHTLFYGFEVVTNDVESSGIDENIKTGDAPVGSSRYPQSTWTSYGAYVSYQHWIADQFLVQAGVRYNLFSLDADFSNNLPFFPFPFATADINDGALTGSLGFVFNPSEDWTISVNASTGFRSPNVDDVGKVFDSEPGSVVIPNPDLEAEYAYNGEVGIAKVFGDVVRLDLTGYYTVLENAMVRRDFTLNGQDSIMYGVDLSQVQAIQNAATANVFGVQAGIEVKLGGGFSFVSKFNYQDGEEELDDGTESALRHAAPWFGTSRFVFAHEKLDLQLYTMYSGEVSYESLSEEGRATDYIYAIDADGNPYSPGWITLNLKVSCPVSDVFTISGGVENLTDKRYRPYSSGLVSAGRNVILSLRAKF